MIYLLIWTFISVVYFWKLIGYKFREDKWYDYIILLPVWVIILLISLVGYIIHLFNKGK